MGVGGPADYLTIAYSTGELFEAVRWAWGRDLPFRVIGLGANTIFSDEGFRGLIVVNRALAIGEPRTLGEALDVQSEQEKHRLVTHSWCMEFDTPEPDADHAVEVESGIVLEDLISWSLERDFAGLEYYTGIPSTIGGAIYSNVHFANHLIGPRILSARVLDESLDERTLSKDELALGYDDSILRRRPYVLLSAEIALSSVSGEQPREAVERRNGISAARDERYPGEKSCGSVFKNISAELQTELGLPHKSAGWLVDQCGLKGYRIGGAVIWEGNANWILNTADASSADVEALIDLARSRVRERFGIELELEVEVIR
jgi:UDP-N-acetylmuramate dehydrogenase